ncbi:MAG: hypothetical protein DDT19_01654 [Syntrophomonadaceae bacterium]|nr:hypothetical protein [Bacillota bacterium]
MPRRGMTEGGIWPAVLGTVYLTLITAVASVPFGVFAAIYLNEYAKKICLHELFVFPFAT